MNLKDYQHAKKLQRLNEATASMNDDGRWLKFLDSFWNSEISGQFLEHVMDIFETKECFNFKERTLHGSLNVPIEHHPTIGFH